MINGAHAIVYSQDAEADRAFFKDILGFPSALAAKGVACEEVQKPRWIAD